MSGKCTKGVDYPQKHYHQDNRVYYGSIYNKDTNNVAVSIYWFYVFFGRVNTHASAFVQMDTIKYFPEILTPK